MKGPSVTVTRPPESRTRAPCAVGPKPPFPSMVPALTSSCAKIAIASINSLGGGPWLSACFTIIMNLIVVSPHFELGIWAFQQLLEPGCISTTNERLQNRHLRKIIFPRVLVVSGISGNGSQLTINRDCTHRSLGPLRNHVGTSAVVGNRILDECLKDCLIHIRKLFNVETTLACSVLSEFGQDSLCLAVGQHAVQNDRGLARRKTDKRHVAFTATVIFVVIAAKANNGWSPESRFFARSSFHNFNQFSRL